jgi:hypothetical protein
MLLYIYKNFKNMATFVILQIFNILSKGGERAISDDTLDSLSKDDLRQLLLILERYEPSNMYTYEYSYIREQDIR